MRILVAGGAGFIGRNLCDYLLQRDYEVIALDNFSSGSRDKIKYFHRYSNFNFIEHDITNPLSLKIDGIINLACPASPPHYQKTPVETMKSSVLGSINLLELAIRNSATILQASTSEIYGDPLISPQPENYWGNVNPIGLRSCYDEGKRAAETLFFDYHREFSADIRIVRIFNTYGPGMMVNDGRVVSNYIVQALKEEPITVYGDGSQIRSLMHVDDLVDGLMKLFCKVKYTGPVNLGNPEPVSMIQLAKEVVALTNSKSLIEHRDLPSDDPRIRVPDIRQATKDLNWYPRISRIDGLKSTIDYFKSEILS